MTSQYKPDVEFRFPIYDLILFTLRLLIKLLQFKNAPGFTLRILMSPEFAYWKLAVWEKNKKRSLKRQQKQNHK